MSADRDLTSDPCWGACADCGAELRLRDGPHDRFLGCSRYPTCDYTERLDAIDRLTADGKLGRWGR